jgi:acyl-CoA thioesterase FadM
VNLWLRLLWLLASARRRGPLAAPFGESVLAFRVWPHDLDVSLHMNNGRYWTLMDLGRTDLMLRMGLWRAVLRHRWTPVVSAGSIRFRRELRPWKRFTLASRILCWGESWAVIEHRLVSRRAEAEIVHAAALVRVGLYDRSQRAFVPIAAMMAEMGVAAESPAPTPEVRAFLDAEETMKRAA